MKKAQKEASPPETAVEAGGGGGAVEARESGVCTPRTPLSTSVKALLLP